MVRHQGYLVLVGSIPTPKFFSNITKNFEGGPNPHLAWNRTVLKLEG